MLAALLNGADSSTIYRGSMSDIDHKDYHPDCHHELPEDNIDYEDSLEVIGDDVLFRSAEADEKSEDNRTKRNNFHGRRPAAVAHRGHISRPMDDDDDSLEDLNKKLFKQQRMPTSQQQHNRKRILQSHHLMDTSDEEPSWEVKDDSLKKFGVFWDSIKDKKRNRPSIDDDSMEDMRKQQHKAQHLAHIGNRHAF